MVRHLYLFLSFFISVQFSGFSQKIPLIHSGEVISKAKTLYDSGAYAEALKEFAKVPERDTNYVLMLTEAALTHIAAEQYDDVLALCQKGLAKPSPHARYFLRYQAIAEDKKGNFDRSVQLFQEAIRKYPTDFGLLYNLGVTYYNNGKHEKAVDTFFKVLAINPFHAGSHLNLGRISIGQGRKVHGMMSMGMYLGISNTDNPRLVLLNNFVDNQVTDEGSVPGFGLNEGDKLDQIIRAKIAMDKNFKSRVPVDAAVVRQFEMFFQQMNVVGTNNEDPWIKVYLPIYRLILDQNLADAFIYHILTSSPNTNVKKWLSKNEKTLGTFYSAVNGALKKHRAVVDGTTLGYPKPVQGWYNDDNILVALGESTPQEIRKGHWKFFHNNYQMSAEGDYTQEGKKMGVWKYYSNDGTIKSIEDYSTGEVTTFFPDGTRREHFFLKNDVIHGEGELFYSCGPVKERLLYENGKRNGKGRSFYPDGNVEMTYEYLNHNAIGEFRTFYADGTLKLIENYKDGALSGNYRSYYPNSKTESEGRYLNGETVGEWKHYHSNGKLSRTGLYNDAGFPIGEWVYYDERAILTEKRQFDDEGRLNGVNTHYSEGKLHYAETYKKGILNQVIFYDKDGKEKAKHGNTDGSFAVRNYFSTGQLLSEGNYTKGKTNGTWKYYNRFGKLVSEYRYSDGMLEGKSAEYYPSGEKKYDLEYKNNELHGYFREYYKDGRIKQEGWFQNGNREQQWLTYFSDGTVETDSYYLLNSLTGPYYSYYQNGKLLSVADYENDAMKDITNHDSKGNVVSTRKVKDYLQSYEESFASKKPKGKFDLLCGDYVNDLTKWYPDGTLYYSYRFLNGKKHGRYVYNDLTGKIAMEGDYVNNEEEGLWKSFYSNGKLSKEGRYLNGLKDSVWNYYFPDGRMSSSLTYFKDELNGISRYYSPEGTPLVEKLFINGDLIAWRVINENEENGSWTDFSGTATISVKNEQGVIVLEETYKDGLRHGYKRMYFNNGKPYEEYLYEKGDFEGPYVVYFPDGKVKERGTFRNDELNGAVETFNSDGSPQRIENYTMGSLNGKVSVFTKGVEKVYTFSDGIIE